MTQIEALEALTVKMDGTLRKLHAGETLALPDSIAVKLMERAAGRVRLMTPEKPIVVEPAAERVAYWEGQDGCLRKGVTKWLGKVGHDYWVFIESSDRQGWVREDLLRSREQYESQHDTGTEGTTTLVDGQS